MKLNDFSTEQLEFISKFTKNDIKFEIEKRKEDDIRNKFQINVGDCFLNNMGDSLYTIYKIINIDNNNIIYNSYIINESQIEQYDDLIIEKEYSFFHELEKFDILKYNNIDKEINGYNKKFNYLHSLLYKTCINLIKN